MQIVVVVIIIIATVPIAATIKIQIQLNQIPHLHFNHYTSQVEDLLYLKSKTLVMLVQNQIIEIIEILSITNQKMVNIKVVIQVLLIKRVVVVIKIITITKGREKIIIIITIILAKKKQNPQI